MPVILSKNILTIKTGHVNKTYSPGFFYPTTESTVRPSKISPKVEMVGNRPIIYKLHVHVFSKLFFRAHRGNIFPAFGR